VLGGLLRKIKLGDARREALRCAMISLLRRD